ncbi:uncharacterized protein LOC134767028 [Penaeus indicus]|uniref:uncharacterized protein LOC134767028 n=1 Tax=Penaeus indicus TaxID=29960 RepID=UPI00300D0E70
MSWEKRSRLPRRSPVNVQLVHHQTFAAQRTVAFCVKITLLTSVGEIRRFLTDRSFAKACFPQAINIMSSSKHRHLTPCRACGNERLQEVIMLGEDRVYLNIQNFSACSEFIMRRDVPGPWWCQRIDPVSPWSSSSGVKYASCFLGNSGAFFCPCSCKMERSLHVVCQSITHQRGRGQSRVLSIHRIDVKCCATGPLCRWEEQFSSTDQLPPASARQPLANKVLIRHVLCVEEVIGAKVNVNDTPTDMKSTTLRLGSWNIRTLCPGFTMDPNCNLDVKGAARKTAFIDHELHNLAVDITALQGTRIAESGSIREKNYTFFWRGKAEEEPRILEVGFAVSNQLIKDCDTPIGVSERIMTLTLRRSSIPVHIICIYAPTLPSEDIVKDQFYNRLADVLDKFPRNECLVLLGDFNARVGSDHATWPDTIGHYGVGKINENGQRVLELCSQQQLCITNIWFKQKLRRRVTWRHPRSKHWHQLDLAIIRKKDIGLVKSSRSYHSADGDTDHTLVVTHLKLPKCKRVRRTKIRLQLNIANMKLAENIFNFQKNFTIKMSESASNDTENETSSKKWKTLRTSMMEAALESFGKSRPPKEDWMAEFAITLDPLLEAKSEAHRVHNNRPTRASHRALRAAQSELQRTSRACANQFWNTLCDEIQTAADMGNQRKLYQCLRKAIGPTTKRICPLKSKDGTLIVDPAMQLVRWVEHYSELYGEPRGISAAALEATPNLDVMMELDQIPTIEELVIALSHTPSGKSPGADGIPADLLKCDASLLPHLYELLCKCWHDAAFPADMKNATIVTLYKQKGDKGDCNNYRGISLMSVTGKTFARVLLPRLQKIADRIYPESQCGFRSGRSTADMIFSVRQIQEKCREQNRPLHMAFVDLTKAFDMVSREGMFAVLQKLGCPPTLLKLIRSLHDDMQATISFEGAMSEHFGVRSGVKQGCVLAPTLFGIFFSTLLHHAFGNYNDNDNIYLHTSPESLQSLMDRFSTACSDFSLIISTKKTVVMNCSTTNSPPIPISVENQELNVVDKFCYLGSTISTDLTLDREMEVRIGKASTAFSRLRARAWNNRLLTERTKTRIYESCVLSVLLYGSETWTTYTRHEKKLNAFHMRNLRRIIGVSWKDHVTNEEVLTRTGSHSMFYILKARRMRWLGHLRRMNDGRLPKDILYGELSSGQRQRGRPVLRFKDCAKRDLAQMGIPLDNWEVTASDRGAWKTAVRDGSKKIDSDYLESLRRRRVINVCSRLFGYAMGLEAELIPKSYHVSDSCNSFDGLVNCRLLRHSRYTQGTQA